MRIHWRGLAGIAAGSLICGLFPAVLAAQDLAPGPPAAAEPGPEAAEPTADSSEEQTERARQLFSEGIDHVERREWEAAADKFREAQALRDAPAIRYNLASALFEMDELREADALVEGVLADPETPAEVRTHAQTLRTQIRERAGVVTVHLDGASEGVTVQVDGDAIEDDRIGAEMALSPGTHTFVATQGGLEVAREEVTVAAGESREVRLAVAPSPSEAAAAGDPFDEPVEENGESSLLGDWRLWAAVGGAVAVVAIVVIAVAASGGVEDPVEGNFEPGVLRW